MQSEIVNGTWKGYLGRGLAPRELQFLLFVAVGLTAKEIAREAGISPATVAKRLTNAMYKLGVTRRAALVAEAMRRQIISPLCFALVALLTMNAVANVQSVEPARRDRRPPSVRIAQVRITRRSETLEAA
ncbi:helix-turn-helix transcriptional regulator [Pseudomonas sp. SZMC_28357]|uniref:response regulator transcription factor n=1 Tax=Pseudomonas sp. SZMC_28357 TaxID=3074380 RepID=UPI002871B4B9|nr:helix-turn-helix transcriptional regulator [Pseudomonas sp. SZMC_28357]MDR9749875.1 helix-turn-helix transcriptional regulator [Pseudomonas sp. SZMC_28357]